jgi:tight adherence protein C
MTPGTWTALLVVVAAICILGFAARPRVLMRTVPSSAPSTDVAGPRTRPARTRGRRTQRTVARAFPDALDLFVVTVQAGYPPLEAIASLRPLVHASIGDVFQVVLERVARGERFGDALASITDALGPRGSAFVDTLAMTERSGLPLAPAIDRIADDARHHRHQLADADARQLPIRLSFPLVLCTLSSFVLVAIVPLLLGALTSFDRSSP